MIVASNPETAAFAKCFDNSECFEKQGFLSDSSDADSKPKKARAVLVNQVV